MLDKSLIPIPEPTVASRLINTEQPGNLQAVLVLPTDGKVKVLNEVGARIWTLVDGRRSIDQIAEHIFLEYETNMEQALVDTMEFVNELIKAGAVKLPNIHS